jgi:hypothetical protein
MNGKSIQYYIEAKDDKGNVVKNAGSQADPNIVAIDPNAKPVMVAGDGEAAPAAAGDGKVARADLDDEAAPIMGSVGEGSHGSSKRSGGGGKRFGAGFYVGLVFLAGGAAMLGSGFWALGQAQSYANALTSDSMGNNGMPYKFVDPNASPYDDRTVQQRGQSFNTMGIGLVAAGSVVAVAGIVAIAVDQTVMKKRRDEKPKRSAWIAPAVTPTYAGLGGGISF